ncbi:putative G-protein coupled receptor [Aphelenchoides besseyi]|nr:putative G-protein coupled receptor [Aphelenchoides besseyi]
MNATGAPTHAVVLPPPVQLQIVAYCYILPVICVLGIVGNVMNIITLASRRLRAVSYMYLRGLATADLLCMLFVLAFATCEVLNYLGFALAESWWFGFYQAHFMLSLINWALSTANAQVVALSLERYVSVVFPMHFRQWNSPTRARRAIFIAYIIPALFYLPYAFNRYEVATKERDGRIVYFAADSEASKTVAWQIYKWTREAILRFAPIIILSILNLQIMSAFRRRQKMFARLTNRDQSQSRDETLLYLLGAIVGAFFICNIGAAVNLLLINEQIKQRFDYQIFRAVANLLEITNHAAQFYIFCACSSDYRAAFRTTFPCFQAYYSNRDKIRSFMKRGALKDEFSEKQRPIGMSTSTANAGVGGTSSQCSQLNHKRSTTATIEPISLSCCPPNTVDLAVGTIQLASAEDDLITSDEESDSLLCGTDTHDELNGTTFL